MNIVNQDRDMIVSTKDVDYAPVYSPDTKVLLGFNIFGIVGDEKYLLGTVEDDIEAIGIVTDINIAIENGDKWYYMCTDLDHLEVD
jgi:hypothetical protein